MKYQKYTSAETSINSKRVPAGFKKIMFLPNSLNLDYGGGKYDTATEYLATMGATNIIYDPFNRSEDWNKRAIYACIDSGGADSCTLFNVLNVIMEKWVRISVLHKIRRYLKKGAPIYITVYEGDKSGVGKVTCKGYQMNAKTEEYLEEIRMVFPNAVRRGKMIICHNDYKVMEGLWNV